MSVLVDIKRLPAKGLRISGEEPASVLELDAGSDVQLDSPLSYNLHVERVGSELLVRGSVATRVRAACSRCGKPFQQEVRDAEFDRSFDLDGDEVPWAPEPADAVDLTADIREATILLLPSYPVCRTDCRGLCPTCGADRNEGKCGCKPDRDDRWNTLNQLSAG